MRLPTVNRPAVPVWVQITFEPLRDVRTVNAVAHIVCRCSHQPGSRHRPRTGAADETEAVWQTPARQLQKRREEVGIGLHVWETHPFDSPNLSAETGQIRHTDKAPLRSGSYIDKLCRRVAAQRIEGL